MKKNGKKIIIGNWKMNPDSLDDAKKIFSGLKALSKNFKTRIVVCAPFIYLSELSKQLNNKGASSSLSLGAQNVFWQNPSSGSKPFTGEVSASMLKNLGVEYAILGHSERRSFGEDDEAVNKKIKSCLSAGLKPIVCVGEQDRDQNGNFFETLKIQIKKTFDRLKKTDLKKIIIAYEPIWAIGKSDKESMKGEDLYQMTIFIRKIIAEIYGKDTAFSQQIIYGGSVSSFNVENIVSEGQVVGILPGRSSLDLSQMKEMLEILEKI